MKNLIIGIVIALALVVAYVKVIQPMVSSEVKVELKDSISVEQPKVDSVKTKDDTTKTTSVDTLKTKTK